MGWAPGTQTSEPQKKTSDRQPSHFFPLVCERHAACHLSEKHLTAERISLLREGCWQLQSGYAEMSAEILSPGM
jgi:hypothetical protein